MNRCPLPYIPHPHLFFGWMNSPLLNFLMEEMRVKLKEWKGNLLFHARGEVIIKYQLASIPMFHTSMGIIPKIVMKEMETMM